MIKRYQTVDVFTPKRFGGNPLAVVFDADDLTTHQMQQIAREFNYSETTFICGPKNPQNTAHVRIFTPGSEMPFAGHPNVGTAFVLARLAEMTSPLDMLLFEEHAGLVPVKILRNAQGVMGAELTAPEPLSVGEAQSIEMSAACVGLEPGDILSTIHAPCVASVGAPFMIAEVATRDALARARPNRDGCERFLLPNGVDAIYIYTRQLDARDGAVDFSARMFAPFDGIAEDPATGSATGAVCALLASRDARLAATVTYSVAQGINMGRPSLMMVKIEKADGVVSSVRVGGACVEVARGEMFVS
jgi:trans-2,3-dihydro-3-hydroxyanthranilate isomerase